MSSRAELVAAALERWEKWSRLLSEADDSDAEAAVASDLAAAGDALAALLRIESQPAPCAFCRGIGQVESVTPGCPPVPCPNCSQPEPAPVVGDDEALLARWNRTFLTVQGSDSDKCRDLARIGDALATRLTSALADVARLTEERDAARQEFYNYIGRSEPITSANQERDRFRDELTEARAALATAEEAKAKAVDEEREACRMIAANYALNCVDSAGRFAANTIGERIRARAGRNQ